MLLKILGSDLSLAASSYVSAQLLTDAGAPISYTAAAIETTWFSLKKYTDVSTSTQVTISSIVDVTIAEGKFNIIFDATTTPQTGDILVLTGSGNESTTNPFSKIKNTVSIDTGLGTVSDTGQSIFTQTPIVPTNTTAPNKFNFVINTLTNDGLNYTEAQVIPLTTPIVVYGVLVKSIKIQVASPKTAYVASEGIAYTVTFHTSTDGTGAAVQFDGNPNDILSIGLNPIV